MAKEKPQTFGLITEPTKMRPYIVRATKQDNFEDIWVQTMRAKDIGNLRKNIIATYKEQALRIKDGIAFHISSADGSKAKVGSLYIWSTAMGNAVFHWMTNTSMYDVMANGELYNRRRL